jgi:zinc transport system substrate-binding protein
VPPRRQPGRAARTASAASVLAALALGLAGCSAQGPASDQPSVVVGAYPFAAEASAVAGPDATVIDLAPPGGEPHDLELSPHQTADVAGASLVMTVPGFQPALDDAIAQNLDASQVLDLADVINLRPAPPESGTAPGETGSTGAATDPHVWQDPTNMAAIGTALARRLATIDPDHASDYEARARTFAAQMHALDAQFRTGLADCVITTIVTGHAAFAYLAARYGLTQVAVTGLDPEVEPSGAQLAAVLDAARAAGVTTVFTEAGANQATANALADELNVSVATLNPIEFVTGDQTYESLMRDNLATLERANQCQPAGSTS